MGLISKGVRSLAVKETKAAAAAEAKRLAEEQARRMAKREAADAARAAAPSLAAKPVAAPAIIKNRSRGRATAQDVMREAAAPSGKARPSFSDWRAQNDASLGDMFDYSRLNEVPDVRQWQLERLNPKRGPSERIVSALDNPEVERGLTDTVLRGIEGGGLGWYNTEPLRERMFKATSDANQAYPQFMDIIAATSPRSKVSDNIRTGTYYNYLMRNQLPLPDKPAKGYGSIAQKLHRSNMDAIGLDGWDIFKNPKPASFSQNLQGNQHVATIDTHNMRLPGILSRDPRFLETSIQEQMKGNKESAIQNLLSHYPGLSEESLADAVSRMPDELGSGKVTYRPQRWHEAGELDLDTAINDPSLWTAKPNDNEYGYYEKWQQQQANDMGISPAQYQASMWLGGGDDTGLASTPEPFLKTMEARVKYTADRLGVSPDVILEQMLKGEIPLLAKGGRIDANALAAKYNC